MRYFLILMMLGFIVTGCVEDIEGKGDGIGEPKHFVVDDSEIEMPSDPPVMAEEEIESGYDERVKNILFAHGYSDDEHAWNTFADYVEENKPDWKVYRTSVSPKEYIATRARELAEYIVQNKDDIADDSLIIVAHSMGGLDSRYMIGQGHAASKSDGKEDNPFYIAAKKVHKLYTLATPHGGNQFGGTVEIDHATGNLAIKFLREFNRNYPYTTFSIDDRKIQMLALRFHCGEAAYAHGVGFARPSGDDDTDGTVAVKRQILFGAPFTQSIFHGRHTSKLPNMCSTDVVETEMTDTILKGIIENKKYYEDTVDIVFYEHTYCEGDEKGVFSSTYKDGALKCIGGRCDNDEIASVMIYPGIKKNTTIKLYDDPDRRLSDDWTRIHIGEEMSEAYCINGLEHNTTSTEKSKGIIVNHHPVNGLNGKVSSLNIFNSSTANDPVDIVLYEDKSCGGNIVGTFQSQKTYSTNCKESDRCVNDEAQSMMIYPHAKKGIEIRLYNDPNGETDKSWLKVSRGHKDFSEPYCINNLQSSYTSDLTDMELKYDDNDSFCVVNCGLGGNVSRVEID